MKRQDNRPTQEIDNFDNYETWIKENLSLIESAITYDTLNLSSS